MFVQVSYVLLLASIAIAQEIGTCPNGAEAFGNGVTEANKAEIVNIHNQFRSDIENGRVPNQPKGKNLLKMSYDVKLQTAAKEVSKTCEFEHLQIPDDRFPYNYTGQNLYISWSSQLTTTPEWTKAVTSWFNEHNNFQYPDKSTNGKQIGHYTQVVWGSSNQIGCDFIVYYDRSQPSYPYAKLYTCNYGPGGNWDGEAPYELA